MFHGSCCYRTMFDVDILSLAVFERDGPASGYARRWLASPMYASVVFRNLNIHSTLTVGW
jgi:hypothetical protein